MNCPAIVVERIYPEPRVDEQRPRFPRKAIDPDAALVAQLRRADAGAAETLVGAYGDSVYRLAIRITGKASDAEEVVQDALWSVIRQIETFRGDSSLGSWIHRIVANAAYHKLRHHAHRPAEISLDEVVPLFHENGQHADPITDWSASVEDPAVRTELRAALDSAIGELPAHYRAVIVLRDVEGLSVAEVAASVGITVATAKSRVHRGRLFLRQRLASFMSVATTHRGAGEEARFEAEATTQWDTVTVGLVGTLAGPSDLPETVLNYVLRTHEAVIVDDATVESPFSADTYVVEPHVRSALCLPLVKQASLVVENNVASHVFTPSRIALLKPLASQAAISLENARLYADPKDAQAYLAEAQRLSSTGSFGWKSASGQMVWSEEMHRIFALDRGTKVTVDFILSRTHPDDRDGVQQVIERATGAGVGREGYRHLRRRRGG